MGAAFETTSHTLRVTLYHIYNNHRILARLRGELAAFRDEVPSLSELEKLPYLTACITGGLRLAPGLATRQARVSDKPMIYRNYTIPPNTPIGMTVLLMHMDPGIYPSPKIFKPERWLDPDARRQLEKAFGPFGRGTRMCLGMYLAWAEMYTVVATLVRRYDFEFINTGAKDVECVSDQFGPGVAARDGFGVWLSGGCEV